MAVQQVVAPECSKSLAQPMVLAAGCCYRSPSQQAVAFAAVGMVAVAVLAARVVVGLGQTVGSLDTAHLGTGDLLAARNLDRLVLRMVGIGDRRTCHICRSLVVEDRVAQDLVVGLPLVVVVPICHLVGTLADSILHMGLQDLVGLESLLAVVVVEGSHAPELVATTLAAVVVEGGRPR